MDHSTGMGREHHQIDVKINAVACVSPENCRNHGESQKEEVDQAKFSPSAPCEQYSRDTQHQQRKVREKICLLPQWIFFWAEVPRKTGPDFSASSLQSVARRLNNEVSASFEKPFALTNLVSRQIANLLQFRKRKRPPRLTLTLVYVSRRVVGESIRVIANPQKPTRLGSQQGPAQDNGISRQPWCEHKGKRSCQY